MGTFYAQVELGVDEMIGDLNDSLRGFYIELFTQIVMRSPVGNPRNWKINAQKLATKKAVMSANRMLRTRAENVTKSGRLKAGKKLHASAARYNKNNASRVGPVIPGLRKIRRGGDELFKPTGYTGGRFRANWQLSLDSASMGVVDAIDPSGQTAIAALTAVLSDLNVTTSRTAHFVNNLDYAMAIEFGVQGKSPLYPVWSKQAPNGVVRVTLADSQRIFNRWFR